MNTTSSTFSPPNIPNSITSIHYMGIFYGLLIATLFLIEALPFNFNAAIVLLIPWVTLLQLKHRLAAFLHQKQALFFEQKWKPDFGEIFIGIFIPVLFTLSAIRVETIFYGILAYAIFFCVISIYQNVHLLAIFPNGIIVRKGFYRWDQIDSIEWSDDGETLHIHLPAKRLDAAEDVHIDWWIPAERRDVLKKYLF